MKKLILLFILLQVSLFANKFIGIGYESFTTKLEPEGKMRDGIKMELNSYSIDYNSISGNHIVKASIKILPSQLPASLGGQVATSFTTEGYGIGLSFAYKVYNKNKIFIAPNVSLGQSHSTITITRRDEKDKIEIKSIPLGVGVLVGIDYSQNSFAFIEYGFYESDLDSSSSKSASLLKLGISHSIDKDFSVQSSYNVNLDNLDGIRSSTRFFIGAGYSF